MEHPRSAGRDAPLSLVALLLAAACGGTARPGADVAALVEAVRDGRSAPGVVRLTYGEEEPLVRTIEVAVAADGGVTIDTSELRPGCMQQGAAECWNRTVQKRLLASEAHRRLVATVPVAALAELPREDAVAPGAPRVWVTIDGGAAGRVDVRCSRASAERATGFGTLRAAILEMAVSQRSSR